jgi:hypothetical protein
MIEKNSSIIKILNLGLAFLVELIMLVIFGYVGAATGAALPVKILLGFGFPVAAAVFWGIFIAPASKTRLRDPFLTIVKIIVFTLAAVLLYFTGMQTQAIVFEIIVLLNLVLLYIYRDKGIDGRFDREQHGHS